MVLSNIATMSINQKVRIKQAKTYNQPGEEMEFIFNMIESFS